MKNKKKRDLRRVNNHVQCCAHAYIHIVMGFVFLVNTALDAGLCRRACASYDDEDDDDDDEDEDEEEDTMSTAAARALAASVDAAIGGTWSTTVIVNSVNTNAFMNHESLIMSLSGALTRCVYVYIYISTRD